MEKKVTLTLLLAVILSSPSFSQTIWNGPTITFSKADGADWTQAANQDRITSDVWITRADIRGIFNIASESSYTTFESPEGTEWAFGTTDDLGSLDFDNWEFTINADPPAMVDQDMVLHLIDNDIYIDIKFTYWAVGMSGGQGGFTYERSTAPTSNVKEAGDQPSLSVFPNPAGGYLYVEEAIRSNFDIYDTYGKKISEGRVSDQNYIDISHLNKGFYFLRTRDNLMARFIKE